MKGNILFAERQVTGRGCSNKESNFLFEDDCETFQSRDKVEDLSSREEMAQPAGYFRGAVPSQATHYTLTLDFMPLHNKS